MDPSSLVDGGAEGLRQIVRALETEGVVIQGAYLIRLSTEEGTDFPSLRIITEDDPRNVIYTVIRLQHDGKVPELAREVRISPKRPNNVEASRVLDYASRFDTQTVDIRGAYWDGLFIPDAFVVKWPSREPAAA